MCKTKKLAAVTAAGAAVLGAHGVAEADFSGPYAPANWTTTGTNGSATNNGTVLTLVSGNGNGGATGGLPNVGTVSYTITAAGSGTVSFDWQVTDSPDSGTWDYFGVILNGVYFGPNSVGAAGQTGLGNNETPVNSPSSWSFSVNNGDTFGFYTQTRDGGFGGLTSEIFNFSAPNAIPEPSAVALLALGTIGGLGLRRRRS